jgi:diadenosine tetraphosphate (Ap4A) HIT family hydrolase
MVKADQSTTRFLKVILLRICQNIPRIDISMEYAVDIKYVMIRGYNHNNISGQKVMSTNLHVISRDREELQIVLEILDQPNPRLHYDAGEDTRDEL